MVTISVRLDEDTTKRLDAVAVALAERARGARVTRSNALRVVVDGGLEALEAELGITKKRKQKR